MDKFIQVNAVTAGSSFTRVISNDDQLRVRTSYIVIRRSVQGLMEMDLYRWSATAPGKWSRDLYTVDVIPGGRLQPRRLLEVPEKYDEPPAPPPGSLEHMIGGHQVFSRDGITPELLAAIEAMISAAPPRRPSGG